MVRENAFVDHYNILQVSRNCDATALEAAYRRLAKMYHPDHINTADTTKFNEVIAAYRVLRNAKRRADYDVEHARHVGEELKSSSAGTADMRESAALDDADDHAKILMFLYKSRRADAQNPGVLGFYIQEMLNCSDEHFEFHKWYLKEKGYIAITEQGMLAITIAGVDHVISMSRTTHAEKLMIGRSSDSTD